MESTTGDAAQGHTLTGGGLHCHSFIFETWGEMTLSKHLGTLYVWVLHRDLGQLSITLKDSHLSLHDRWQVGPCLGGDMNSWRVLCSSGR